MQPRGSRKRAPGNILSSRARPGKAATAATPAKGPRKPTGTSLVVSEMFPRNVSNECFQAKCEIAVALQEIRRFQKTSELLLPFMAFSRLVREISEERLSGLRWSKDAILVLQESLEGFLVNHFDSKLLGTITLEHTFTN
jgi:histone H3-like centromeric protein A